MSQPLTASVVGALSILAVASACGPAVRPTPLVGMGAYDRADLSALENPGRPLVLVGQVVYQVPEACVGAPRIDGASVARAEGPVSGGPRIEGSSAPAPSAPGVSGGSAPGVSGGSAPGVSGGSAPGVSGGSAPAAERSPGFSAASAAPVVTCVPIQGGRAFQLSGAVSATVDVYLDGRVFAGVPASRVDLDALEHRAPPSGPASP